MDPLGQILNTHIAVEVRIFRVEIRQHVLHPQVEIVGALKFHQTAQQPHRPGFIDPDAEQKQQIIGACFLHHHAAFIKELRHQRSRDPFLAHLALLIHTRRQDRHFYRVEEHMVTIGIPEAMPVFGGRNRPAFCFINLFRLPDIKEPAVGFLFQPLNLFTEMQRALHRAIDKTFTGIAAQHRRSRFDRRHQRIAW